MKRTFKLIFELLLMLTLVSCSATINFDSSEESQGYYFFTGDTFTTFSTKTDILLPYTNLSLLDTEESTIATDLVDLIETNTSSECILTDFQDTIFPIILKEETGKNIIYFFNVTEIKEEDDDVKKSNTKSKEATTDIDIEGKTYSVGLKCYLSILKEAVSEIKYNAEIENEDINDSLNEGELSFQKENNIIKLKITYPKNIYLFAQELEGLMDFNPLSEQIDESIFNDLIDCGSIKILSTHFIKYIDYNGADNTNIYIAEEGTNDLVCELTFPIIDGKSSISFKAGNSFKLEHTYTITSISGELIQLTKTEATPTFIYYVIDDATTPSDLTSMFAEFHDSGTQTISFAGYYSLDELPAITTGWDGAEGVCNEIGYTDIVPVLIDADTFYVYFRAVSPYGDIFCYDKLTIIESSQYYFQGELATYVSTTTPEGMKITVSK